MSEPISLVSVGKTILDKLTPLLQEKFLLLRNFRTELEKLDLTMKAINALLLDAEEQPEHSHQVNDWHQKLRDLLLNVENLLDAAGTEALLEEATAARDGDDSCRCKIHCWTAVCFLFSIPNRLIYGCRMAHKVKSLREKLDAIHADNTNLRLNPRFEERGKMVKHNPTIPFLPNYIVGREVEAEDIKQLLFNNKSHLDISVVSIVGMGGMGKTALAQKIYNDRQVKKHFNLRLWACVSEKFEVKVIIQKILELPSGGEAEFQFLAHRLEEKLSEKKFFLVLDDVWNFNSERWGELRTVLDSGASGSRILVTTRRTDYATEMSLPDPPYALSGLSSSQSWSLFRRIRSGGGNHRLAIEEPLNIPNVEEIQEQIMRKSAGVPLAVKTVASLLCLRKPYEWLSFLRSNELLDAKHDTSLLHNLNLSYHSLTSPLKRCFDFCSLYPKDYKIDVPTLIWQWVALGLIESSPNDTRQSLYDLGLQHFEHLEWRSFFQEIKLGWSNGIESCRMHDLIHDLAVSVAGSNYTEINDLMPQINRTTCHISLSHNLWCPAEIVGHLEKAKQLRTFFPLYKSWYQSGTNWDDSTFKSFISNFPNLRVLELSNTETEVLSDRIQELKHLRYLDISSNDKITRLPNSITMLQNLQVLRLDFCKSLQELPRDINKLVNLWMLTCAGCSALRHMPVGLGELTRLEILTNFVVGKDSFAASKQTGGLDELYPLDKLRGELQIANLGVLRSTTVLSPPPSLAFEIGAAANLKGKLHLESLVLRWDVGDYGKEADEWKEGLKGSEEDADWDESLLEGLQPHSGLKALYVVQYSGGRCPSWISSLTTLVTLTLCWCNVRHGLHHLQGFPILQRLWIEGLVELEYMDEDDDEDGDSWGLTEEGTQNVKASKPFFPFLEKLRLEQCPKLKGWRRRKLPQFPKLSKLVIEDCSLLTSMPLFPTLDKKLVLINTSLEPLLCTMNGSSSSAGHASCSSSSSSSSSGVDLMQYPLSKLKKLGICGIDDPPREWLRGMQHLTSLQQIRIKDCSGLEQTLDWHNISHVPEIMIDKQYINRDGQFQWDVYGWDNFQKILQDIKEEEERRRRF